MVGGTATVGVSVAGLDRVGLAAGWGAGVEVVWRPAGVQLDTIKTMANAIQVRWKWVRIFLFIEASFALYYPYRARRVPKKRPSFFVVGPRRQAGRTGWRGKTRSLLCEAGCSGWREETEFFGCPPEASGRAHRLEGKNRSRGRGGKIGACRRYRISSSRWACRSARTN